MHKKRSSTKRSVSRKKRKESLAQEKWLGQAHLYEPTNAKIRNRSG